MHSALLLYQTHLMKGSLLLDKTHLVKCSLLLHDHHVELLLLCHGEWHAGEGEEVVVWGGDWRHDCGGGGDVEGSCSVEGREHEWTVSVGGEA